VMHATFLLIYGNASLGRWSAVDALIDEHVNAFRTEADMTCPYVRSGPLLGAALLAHRGAVTRAKELAAMVPMDWATPALPEAHHGFALLAWGDSAAARQEAERILAAERRISSEEAPFEAVLLLDALVALEDAHALRAFLPTADRLADGLAPLAPMRDRAIGLLSLWQGNPEEARGPLKQALGRYEQLGQVFEAARTKEFLAQALPADEANQMRLAALGTYEQLGAVPHAERLRQTYGIGSPV
jgi:hypothetical protein